MPRRVKSEKPRESTARRSTRTAEPEPEDVDMAEAPQEEEEEDEAAKLERVLATIANYPDQPLEAVQEPKIRMIGVEIVAHNNQYDRALEAIIDTATMLSDALPTETDALEHPEILKLKAALLTMLDNQHEVTLEYDTLDNDIRKPLAAGRKIVDPASIFDAGIAKRLQTYNSQTTRQKYGKSKVFKNFINSIWESNRSDEPMPPVLNFLPREDGDPEDSDDDLEVGGVTQDYKCPLTLQIYVNPLTSTTCGHTFDADAIQEYVQKNRKCPAAGCDALISLGVLKQDKALQKKAQAAKRRADRDEEVQSEDSIDDD